MFNSAENTENKHQKTQRRIMNKIKNNTEQLKHR